MCPWYNRHVHCVGKDNESLLKTLKREKCFFSNHFVFIRNDYGQHARVKNLCHWSQRDYVYFFLDSYELADAIKFVHGDGIPIKN